MILSGHTFSPIRAADLPSIRKGFHHGDAETPLTRIPSQKTRSRAIQSGPWGALVLERLACTPVPQAKGVSKSGRPLEHVDHEYTVRELGPREAPVRLPQGSPSGFAWCSSASRSSPMCCSRCGRLPDFERIFVRLRDRVTPQEGLRRITAWHGGMGLGLRPCERQRSVPSRRASLSADVAIFPKKPF